MPTAATTITPGTYTVDPVHSSITFTVRHMLAKFRGGFNDFEAVLEVGGDGKLSLTGKVNATSVQVKEPNLAGHLQTPDFFDSERYPEISFTSTSASVGDDGALEMEGDLTMRGVTKHVTAKGELTHLPQDPYGGTRSGIELETTIDRTDFGINWNAELPGGGSVLTNDVTLHVELELKKES